MGGARYAVGDVRTTGASSQLNCTRFLYSTDALRADIGALHSGSGTLLPIRVAGVGRTVSSYVSKLEWNLYGWVIHG